MCALCVCVSNFNGIKHEIRKSIDVDCCDICMVYGAARPCVCCVCIKCFLENVASEFFECGQKNESE